MRVSLPDYRLILCFFLLQIPAYALAGDGELTPQQLVNRMTRATHELNYDGIFIYRHGRQLDTMRIIAAGGDVVRFDHQSIAAMTLLDIKEIARPLFLTSKD